jgi:hypothetical protein
VGVGGVRVIAEVAPILIQPLFHSTPSSVQTAYRERERESSTNYHIVPIRLNVYRLLALHNRDRRAGVRPWATAAGREVESQTGEKGCRQTPPTHHSCPLTPPHRRHTRWRTQHGSAHCSNLGGVGVEWTHARTHARTQTEGGSTLTLTSIAGICSMAFDLMARATDDLTWVDPDTCSAATNFLNMTSGW